MRRRGLPGRQGMNIRRALVCLGLGLVLAGGARAQQNLDEVEIDALRVRDNIWMLVGSGGNITVQAGEQGILVVDTQYAELSDRILAKIRELADGELRYIVNTHYHGDHVGGNAGLRAAGSTIAGGNVGGDIADAGEGAQIVAHENVLLRLATPTGQQAAVAPEAWPTLTYFTESKQMFFNGEGIEILHQPAAHTDGDSLVFFRRGDVISTGDLYRTNGYPIIDLQAGGHIDGLIQAANNIIDLAIPEYGQDGGTLIIPGHGRLSDVGDVINWREMLTIIRDRVRDMVERGMSLEEVKAARPTLDYDPRWGIDQGFWNTELFVEAVYRNLSDTTAVQD